MNDYEKGVWVKIREFQFDEPGIAFCFSDRLARENGWSKEFALRAIEEYRKFIYLCCVADHQVTPSDEIDQVWHLHLTFTKSYWKELCEKTLGRELHHNPTKGGKEEDRKFDWCYANTISSYCRHFEADPPADLWPEASIRFQNANNIRVDKLRNWIIKKPKRKYRIITLVIFLATIGLLNVHAYNNTEVIIGLIMIVVIVIIVIVNWKDGGGKGGGCSSGCATTGCGGSHSGCSTSGCSSGCGGGGCGGGGCGS